MNKSPQPPSPQDCDNQQDSGSTETVEAPPLAPAHEELLMALDRMLTTGTYYPPGHAQYMVVADQCATAVSTALQGRRKVEIEITAEGVNIAGGLATKDDRCARRLYELLEPLNQALLEIHADATTEDLHQALVILKQHHKQLIGSRDYQEIEIEGMPETVTVMGRNLYVRTKRGNGPEQTDSPLNEGFDPNLIPDAALVPTPEGQMMEREFLAVVQGLMQNGDPTRRQDLANSGDAEASKLLGTWVPDHAIKTIRDFLGALESTNSDPMMLHHMIGHAQTALQLTGDPALVELVFEKLRKEESVKTKSQLLLKNRPTPTKRTVSFTLSRNELRQLIDEVNRAAADTDLGDDLITPATADCLGVCLQILQVAPTDELAAGTAATMSGILGAEDLPEAAMQVAKDALSATFRADNSETVDLIMTMICTPLRRAHPTRLGPFLLEVWEGLGSFKAKENAWPHLVNEVLMGLTWERARQKIGFYQALDSLQVTDRTDLLLKLETLQALQEKILAKDIFHAPAPLLYGLHRLLLNSSLAEQHGPMMHKRLAFQKAHNLVTLLVVGFKQYTAAHSQAYRAILAQGVEKKINPELRSIASRHLKSTLNRLPEERRGEPWVSDAVGWLGEVGTAETRPTLENILRQKRFLFFPVWPASCRDAARNALVGARPDDERSRDDDEV